MENTVLDGTDLIFSVDGKALGYSTGCKVSTSVETGERINKETSSGKWSEIYVKKFSEEISADGCVLKDGDTEKPTYDQLKDMMMNEKKIQANYSLREGSDRTGKTTGGYQGHYLITSLELDAQAGEDSKYSVKLQNCGKVDKIGSGLSEVPESDNGESTTE